MPDGLALENTDWFRPEDIAGLATAFEAALAKLGIVDRSDPITLTLAKLIIELAKAGEREPERLCDSADEALVKVGGLSLKRPQRGAFGDKADTASELPGRSRFVSARL